MIIAIITTAAIISTQTSTDVSFEDTVSQHDAIYHQCDIALIKYRELREIELEHNLVGWISTLAVTDYKHIIDKRELVWIALRTPYPV